MPQWIKRDSLAMVISHRITHLSRNNLEGLPPVIIIRTIFDLVLASSQQPP